MFICNTFVHFHLLKFLFLLKKKLQFVYKIYEIVYNLILTNENGSS